MTRPDWAPAGIDIERPNVARMYDYYLGGSHNLGIDREVAEQAIAALPDLPRIAQVNRAFLARAVRYCLDAGVTQFLDLGSGIPTIGNVHEIAQRANPDARVVYVDIDPVAIAHGQAILAGNPGAWAVQGDVRKPAAILDHPDVRRTLDFTRPVAVLLVAVLPFVADNPNEIVSRLVGALVSGSHLVLVHGTGESRPADWRPVLDLYARTPTPVTLRTRDEIERLFDGLDLVEPGLVWIPQWRPDSPRDVDVNAAWSSGLAGVARKP
jgi:hypothetical protein